jgi:hypothetical protein
LKIEDNKLFIGLTVEEENKKVEEESPLQIV